MSGVPEHAGAGAAPGGAARLAPWAIFAGALALRLLYLWQAGRADPFFHAVELVGDSRYYDLAARNVAAGELRPGVPYFLAPLYFYLIGGVYAVFGESVAALYAVQALIGAASCVLVQRIGRRVFSETVGNLAGAGLAVYGLHVYYSGVMLPTLLVTFLNLLFLWLVLGDARPAGRGRLLAAGLVLGLAVAAKPNAILMLPATLVALLIVEWRDGVASWALRGALLALGTAVTLSPFLAHNYDRTGEFVFVTTTGGRNLLKGNGPHANGTHVFFPDNMKRSGLANYFSGGVPARYAVEEDRRMRAAAREHMARHPGRAVALLLKKTMLFFNANELAIRDNYYFAMRYSSLLRAPLLGFGVMVPIGLVAFCFAWRRHPLAWVLYGALGAQLASYVPLFILARYRMVAVACLLPIAAWGVVATVGLLRERRWRALAGLAAAWLLAFGFVHLRFPEFPRERGFADKWRRIGNQALEEGDLDTAVSAYEKALASDWLHYETLSREQATRVSLAAALVGLGRTEEARKHVTEVLEHLPRDRSRWPEEVQRDIGHLEAAVAAGGAPPGFPLLGSGWETEETP